MKKLIALILCIALLSSCTVTVRREEDTTALPDITTAEPTTEPPAETTAEATTEPTTQPTTEAATTEAATEATTITSETATEATTATEAVTEPPVAEPIFDDSFYTRLSDLFAKYGINQKHDIDPEFEEKDASGKVITPRDKCVSVYYYDIETGYELYINEGVHYPVASVVKIPFCTMLYEKITAGELDGEMLLTYEARHKFHGTGVVNKGQYGDQYTVLQLLKLSITESDNTAYEMLKDLVSWEDFERYMQEHGSSHSKDTRARKQKVCLESAGSWGRIMAEFLRSDSPYVEAYKYDLTHTKNKMINSTYTVYRKYGWTQYAFHDIAYVVAPKPYVLAVLTNLEGEAREDYAFYYALSALVEEYALAGRVEPLDKSPEL